MPGTPRVLRIVMVSMLALLGVVTATLGQAQSAVAYWPFDYLDGLDQTITRHYSLSAGDEQVFGIEIDATIARFTGEDAAQAGYDEVTTAYAGGYASSVPEATPEASAVSGLGDASTSFTSVAHQEILLEWYLDTTVMVTRDAADLVIVSVEYQVADVAAPPASTGVARALTDAILAAPAGEGEPAQNPDGSYGGGLWDRLPGVDHEALAATGVDVSWDIVDFPEPVDESTPETSDSSDGELDFASLEGGQRAVSRIWNGDMAALATIESAPAGIYNLIAMVSEFDTDEHAAAALDTIYADFAASMGEDDTFALEELDPADVGDLGDQVVGGTGSAGQDGVPVELTLLVVRDGAWLYMAAALGVGEGAGSLDAASGLARAMIAADAGEGEGTFDESGGSTGGIWDKLPAEGDPALLGLTAANDYTIYPEPSGGS